MKPVTTDISFPKLEERVLQFWRENKIFKRSLDPYLPINPSGSSQRTAPAKRRKSYVFYDGPPFATGLPHYGHLLAGTIKDVVGRFFTMKGLYVDRRFGWDCHGVPVEFEIQKTLGLHGAKAIPEFGIANFNEECRKIVLRYTQEWRRFVERSGRWVDFEREYRTMDLPYMESIWWAIKELWDRGLIYEGLKCVPYSWAIHTPLSNFEAGLNYKTVQDPAITVRVRLQSSLKDRLQGLQLPDYPLQVYIWTTTPWTLPSNLALAVGPDIPYSLVFNPQHKEVAVVASSRLKEYFPQLLTEMGPLRCNGFHLEKDIQSSDLSDKTQQASQKSESYACVLTEVLGKELVGLDYDPIFPYFEAQRKNNAFRIYAGDFVSAEDGTGIVHLASFGEDDVTLFLRNNIPIVDPVDADGKFLSTVKDFAGLHIKEADLEIIASLKKEGKIVSHETVEHAYPFCWRTDTPLIYKCIPAWFVKVTALREKLLAMNAEIHWVPEHLRDGRFGKALEVAPDWAISRNRYWGTPLPIWRCDGCGELRCIGSVAELEEASVTAVTDLHSHFVDPLSWSCKKCNGTLRRIPEVLDCWFESGAMPYAQAHYPFEGKDDFEANFPADFIAEGLDQTRGWFYTLLVLSTALFERPAFKNVVVNGIVLAQDGKKMSKSLKNYPPPDEVMDEFGADAMRLYLLSSAATRAEDLRFSKPGVKEVVRQALLPLWNAYNFFVTYALVDGYAKRSLEPSTNLLDRWILSKLGSLIEHVDSAFSSYHLYAATTPLLEFIDQLTNWYIRLNRRRFWAGNTQDEVADKLHAHTTLHQVLLTFVRVLAPLAPFVSEEIFQNLIEAQEDKNVHSVHLTSFPSLQELEGLQVDTKLEKAMELFEQVILVGRSLRNDHQLKVRQPLSKLTIIHPDQTLLQNLRQLDSYIREELNIKHIDYISEEDKYVTLQAQLNMKLVGGVLGPKLGSEGMKRLRRRVEALSPSEIQSLENGKILLLEEIPIAFKDVFIKRTMKPEIEAGACSGQVSIVLDTSLSQELRLEGLAREFVNRVQKLRKDLGFEVIDRIVLKYMTAYPQLSVALDEHRDYIMRETLAVEMKGVSQEAEILPPEGDASSPLLEAQSIDDKAVIISLTRIQA